MPNRKRSLKRKYDSDNPVVPAECPSISTELTEKLKLVESGFFLKLPVEYAHFYQFCCELKPEDPLGAIEGFTGLRLVGPYELLDGKFSTVTEGQFSKCYRYFHDPPEFVTLLAGSKHVHFGVFRDLPTAHPVAFVGFDPPDSGKLKVYATNIFTFVLYKLKSGTCQSASILDKIRAFMKLHNISLENPVSELVKQRSRCVCPTLHSMGLSIPLKAGDIGYRPLSVTYAKLSSMLQKAVEATEHDQLVKLEPIDEIITYAQFACDEGDYGQGIDLGLSLLAFEPKGLPSDRAKLFDSRIQHLLTVGYKLADRSEFAKVIQEHMNDRRLTPRTLDDQK